ncbi:MAG: hypothetical protein V4475_14270 [Pseudomonadota bacterium]
MNGPLDFNILQALVSGYALWRGGAPERWAGVLLALAAAATYFSYSPDAVRFRSVEAGVLVVDLTLTGALWWLALRSNRMWPMLITALQFASTLVHLSKAVDLGMSPWAYHFLLKLGGYPILLALVIGTTRHQMRLRRFGVDMPWGA